MPANVTAKIDALDRMIWSKETWLSDHGHKRPEHEVSIQRDNLAALEGIRDDYRKSLERASATTEVAS